jgi:hypothetical protein
MRILFTIKVHRKQKALDFESASRSLRFEGQDAGAQIREYIHTIVDEISPSIERITKKTFRGPGNDCLEGRFF